MAVIIGSKEARMSNLGGTWVIPIALLRALIIVMQLYTYSNLIEIIGYQITYLG